MCNPPQDIGGARHFVKTTHRVIHAAHFPGRVKHVGWSSFSGKGVLIIAIDIGNLNVFSTAKKFLNEPNILS